MKTKVFLMSLALSCLWSCQQNESEELITARTINFTSVVIGDEVLSRAGGTSIDVISMRTELDDAFTVFNLREDTRSWEEFGGSLLCPLPAFAGRCIRCGDSCIERRNG